MSYVSEILERANVQSVCNFLLFGCENTDNRAGNYETRLKEAYHKYAEAAEQYGITEETELHAVLIELLSTYERSYIEIGVQAGFLLAKDITMDSGKA